MAALELFDSHCHLADRAFAKDGEEVLARAWAAGVVGLVCVGYDLPSSCGAVRLAGQDERIWAAVGVHPHEASKAGPTFAASLRDLARSARVVAIGEAGLDFFRDLSPRPVQREVFRRQAELALELNLPLVVHDRDAHEETLAVLREYYPARGGTGTEPAAVELPATAASPRPPGVMHCFSGDLAMARACLNLGFYVSFAGPLTFPNAVKARETAAALPLSRLLVETDSPYLAPQSARGRRNEPALVAEVARALGGTRGVTPDEAARQTTTNARRVFGLGLAGAAAGAQGRGRW